MSDTDALGAVAASLGSVERGLAGFLAALWSRALKYEAADPAWPDRDRFVLSDGTLSPLLYGLLHLTGFAGMDRSVLARFGRLGSAAAPWPLPAQHPAIEAAAGLPGQGLASGVGIALGERVMAARFGRSLVDHRTWVLASPSDLSAGLGQEAAALAGRLRLERLAVVFAEPDAAGDEKRDKEETELLRRFSACGWTVRSIDGEDEAAVNATLAAVNRARRPTLIACRPSGRCRPGTVAPAARVRWSAAGSRGGAARRGWLRRLARHRLRGEFEQALTGRLPPGWHRRIEAADPTGARSPEAATLDALRAVAGAGRTLLFLTSTRTEPLLDGARLLAPGAYDGRHLACGAQEHGAAALANGLSLHGGVVPVLLLPAIAADRIRPGLRVAALTGRKLVLLLTDDGLAAAAEGAAFQPVEQLPTLRAMPGVFVFRPSCPVETRECLELALRRTDGPSVLLLGADPVDAGRVAGGENQVLRGAHVLAGGQRRDVTLLASGVEVGLALAARAALARDGIDAAVVSLPCWELFERQPDEWRAEVLGQAPRVGVEAAAGFGWERWLGPGGRFVGLDGFGASGEPGELRDHLGLTVDAVVAAARDAAAAAASEKRAACSVASAP